MEMKSLAQKITTCLVAVLCIIALLLNVFNTGPGIPGVPPGFTFYVSAILIVMAAIWPVIWHTKQRNNTIHSGKHFEILYNIIRYTLAFQIAFFGWGKILELQFRVPESIASVPMNQQSGEWLTWYYFGYSYTFTLILAVLQLAGAALLLYRKTVLFGAIILFALMSNITLINIFYGMNKGALLFSVIITIGITYIILLDYHRLVAFFFTSNTKPYSLSKGVYIIRTIFWFSAIVLSLLFALYLKSTL